MKERIVDRSWWFVALWSTIIIAIAIAITVLTAIVINDFQWHLFPVIMKVFWLTFLVIVVMVDIIIVLITKFPLGTISVTLLATAFIFMLASVQNPMGQELRSIVSNQVELDYLVASITFMAFFFAIVAIYKVRSKD